MKQDADGNYLVNGQKVLIPFLYKSTDNMMIQMLQQKGAGYSNAAGQIMAFNETTKELLRTIGESSAIGAFNTFKSIGYPANYLNAGQCIFAVDSTAGATWMGSEAPLIDIPPENLVHFETVVMPVPQFDPQHPQMISQGPSLCVFNKGDDQQVLASWLFAQFMLTDRVQIDYSQTEGYVPVTSKAMETAEYQTYLASSGIDGEKHYSIKLDAVQLLLDNVDNTFVTAVFNGSASLRNAAGQMIEDVRKSAKRGEALDDAYMEKLFSKMQTQYHLDQIVEDTGPANNGGHNRQDLGPLPTAAVVLLVCLGCAWVLICIYVVVSRAKSKKIMD
jgi:multiple sugar transport system substrate-binding protein